ncbi:MAG: hypothetical protein ACOCSL_03555 [Thermoplasmatota archaeon]
MPSKNVFDRVMKEIKKVRDPGEKPEDDLFTMDKYICDLCQGVRGREEITQCGFCGRWVCKGDDSCWNEEFNACESCTGIIKLARDSGDKEKKVKKEVEEDG